MPENFYSLLARLAQDFIGAGVRISPVYLLVTVLIAYAVFRARRVGGGFFAWLLPKTIVFHRSHITDIKLYAVGRLLSWAGVLGSVSADRADSRGRDRGARARGGAG